MRSRVPVGAGLAIVVGLVVPAACGGSDDADADSESDGEADGPSVLDGTTFVASELSGQTLVPDTELIVTFEDGRLAAVAGCNTLLGGYAVEADVLVVDGLAQTMMACPSEHHVQDTWVAALLEGRPTVALDGAVLTLAGDAVTATFEEHGDPPAHPLDGSAWRIVSLASGGTTFTAPDGAYVVYDGGRAALSTGCNTGAADVTILDGTITFGAAAMTLMACVGEVAEFETAVLDLLAGPLEYEVDGDDLTLSNDDSTLALQRIP